jgi:hypothetical protein
MNLFPNFAAQRRPQFSSRIFQRPSVVVQRYRAPELLGAAVAPKSVAEGGNIIQTPSGPVWVWPSYWNPAMRPKPPADFHIEPWWPLPGPPGPGPVLLTPSTPVQAPAATQPAAPAPVVVTPSTLVESTPAATTADEPVAVTAATPVMAIPDAETSWTDEISAWLNGEMISGVPNYCLALGAAGIGLLMFGGKRGRR